LADFEPLTFEVNGIEVAGHVGGSGSPLLLLHGHPQTRAIWHKVAPELMKHHTLVMTDLRGYGHSSKPQGTPDHSNYSKRVMAQDQVEVMKQLGFDRFDILAHDRGARVAHRLAMDHADSVSRLIMLDIAPTLAMYEKANNVFARAYWHWFFLIQPSPLPERLIEADPAAYIRDLMGRRSAGLTPFDPLALAEYMRCIALPGAAHGMCEDYRAAAGIDLIHDREDIAAGKKLVMPTMVLWGEEGVIHQCFKPLQEWQAIAKDVVGESVPCGHYISEEAPEILLQKIIPFLSQTQ
jgi:haloacetate dehalogenase